MDTLIKQENSINRNNQIEFDVLLNKLKDIQFYENNKNYNKNMLE